MIDTNEVPDPWKDARPFEPPDWIDAGPGNFPWDRWEKMAIEASVGENLAGIGRAVMREAYQHSWPADLKEECGWNDEGHAMIELALSAPAKAEKRWQYLLSTDGERA